MPIDAREQERRRTLIEEHYAAENDHDLERIMDTFADDAVMQFNHLPLEDDEGIRGAHIALGGLLAVPEDLVDLLHRLAVLLLELEPDGLFDPGSSSTDLSRSLTLFALAAAEASLFLPPLITSLARPLTSRVAS